MLTDYIAYNNYCKIILYVFGCLCSATQAWYGSMMECIKLMLVGEVRKTDLYSLGYENMRPWAIQRIQLYLLTCFYVYQTPLLFLILCSFIHLCLRKLSFSISLEK